MAKFAFNFNATVSHVNLLTFWKYSKLFTVPPSNAEVASCSRPLKLPPLSFHFPVRNQTPISFNDHMRLHAAALKLTWIEGRGLEADTSISYWRGSVFEYWPGGRLSCLKLLKFCSATLDKWWHAGQQLSNFCLLRSTSYFSKSEVLTE
jgi:hypothetical protein